MPLFRRRRNADSQVGGSSDSSGVAMPVDEELNEQAKEVMKDNLELMKDVVMKIREDPEFASNIYANCPRLQHLLAQYPDLRPIFEDPKLVRINFEQVYRDAGGVLPEDEEKKKPFLVWLVNSPIFKIFKLLLFVKKIVSCILGGGFACVSGFVVGCCCEDGLEEIDADELDAGTDAAKAALNKAADHMEDPAVQEQMQALLEDPDNLQEAIENDPDLKALRDSNPLCEQLMSDPETMRVLTDPDNLRALGEAPSLIELDFADPDGFTPPDFDAGGVDGLDGGGYDVYDGGDGMDFGEADADFDLDVDEDVAVDDGFDVEAEEPEDDGGGWLEDAEFEGQDQDPGDTNNSSTDATTARIQAKAQAAVNQEQTEAPPENTGLVGGIMATIGVAATELIGASVLGNVFGSDMLADFSNMTGMGEGGMGAGGLDALGGGTGGGGDMNLERITEIADDANNAVDNDIAGVAEDTLDKADEKAGETDTTRGVETDFGKDDDGKKAPPAAGVAVAGAAVTGGAVAAGVAASRSKGKRRDIEQGEDDGFQDEEEPEQDAKKEGRFGLVGNLVSTIRTQAKEYVAGKILGEDFGEAFVARQEERRKAREKDDNGEKDDGEPKRPGFFGRGGKKSE